MYRSTVLVCGGTGCTSSGSIQVMDNLKEEIKKHGLAEEVEVVQTGCHGLCALGPIVIVYPDATYYANVQPEDAAEIVAEHLLKGRPVERLIYREEEKKELKTLKRRNSRPSTILLFIKSRCVLPSVTAVLSTLRRSRSTSAAAVIRPSAKFSPR